MTHALGVVALVALTPLIAIQIMGMVYQYKLKKADEVAMREDAFLDGADEIFEFEEDYADDSES